jgi:hypothetical protein
MRHIALLNGLCSPNCSLLYEDLFMEVQATGSFVSSTSRQALEEAGETSPVLSAQIDVL